MAAAKVREQTITLAGISISVAFQTTCEADMEHIIGQMDALKPERGIMTNLLDNQI